MHAEVFKREPVSGPCVECGAEELKQYPILSAEGWRLAIKCQACLATASSKPWHRLGWVRLPEDDI